MALSKKPVNGMKDILPKEMEVRNYVTGRFVIMCSRGSKRHTGISVLHRLRPLAWKTLQI